MDVAECGGLSPTLEARAWECVSMPVHEEVEDVAEVDTALGGKGNESAEGFKLVGGDMTVRRFEQTGTVGSVAQPRKSYTRIR
jgi:hypothetical protein